MRRPLHWVLLRPASSDPGGWGGLDQNPSRGTLSRSGEDSGLAASVAQNPGRRASCPARQSRGPACLAQSAVEVLLPLLWQGKRNPGPTGICKVCARPNRRNTEGFGGGYSISGDPTRLAGQLPAVAGTGLSDRQWPGGTCCRSRHQYAYEKAGHALEAGECYCCRGFTGPAHQCRVGNPAA